jgi:hypothetical protein
VEGVALAMSVERTLVLGFVLGLAEIHYAECVAAAVLHMK